MRAGRLLGLTGAYLLVLGAVSAPSFADWPLYGKDLANSRDGGAAGPSPQEVSGIR